MNQLEKALWAAAFIVEVEGLEKRKIDIPDESIAVNAGVEAGDLVVKALRNRIEKLGRLHIDDDLEHERVEEDESYIMGIVEERSGPVQDVAEE